MKRLIILVLVLLGVSSVMAQPPHSCGIIYSLSVTYDRDAAGYFPRMASGSQDQFNCIAARDPNFNNMRFDAGWKAFNYWFGLYEQELGVSLLRLPPPPI